MCTPSLQKKTMWAARRVAYSRLRVDQRSDPRDARPTICVQYRRDVSGTMIREDERAFKMKSHPGQDRKI